MFSAEQRVFNCRAFAKYICGKENMLPYLQSAASAVQCKRTGSLLDKNSSQSLVCCQHDIQWGYENFRIVDEVYMTLKSSECAQILGFVFFEETFYDGCVKLILPQLFGELNTEEGAKTS
jgi:hypothetical protein